MAITYNRVPMFGYQDRYISEKQQGFGWDNLGQRDVKWVTLHRMVGTLWGTDGYFRNPSVSSMTDYGLGIESVSGKKNAGLILRWNDPYGIRSGWASGPVSAPFGDGKTAVDKYGVNGVNRFGVSLEIDGTDQPLDAVAWQELVHFVAYFADQKKIPHTKFPISPETGFSFVIWHTEFTAGTGKKCPFAWLRAQTARLIDDVRAFLKKYQEGTVSTPVPTPKPPVDALVDAIKDAIPVNSYGEPVPVPKLAALGGQDKDTAKALVLDGTTQFTFVNDTIRAIRETPRLQRANKNAKHIGPVIKKGEEFDVLWHFVETDGTAYYMTPWWSRVLAVDTERIKD